MPVRETAPHAEVAGTVLFEARDEQGRPIPGANVAIVGLIHGNEIVGESVLTRLAELARDRLVAGTLLLVRANVEAQALNRRHTPDGMDLNRQWDAERLEQLRQRDPVTLCYEERRALELAPLLMTRDAILDLHSTSRPTPPFLVFRDDQQHADIASRLGVDYLVTGLHEGAILDGGLCPDVGLWPGDKSPRVGFTFESGQHLDPANIERAFVVCLRFLHRMGVWREAPPPPSDFRPLVYEVTDRFRQTSPGLDPYRFVGFLGGEPGAGRHAPLRTLSSFEEIEADEVILKRGRNTVLRAQTPFTMLLPTPSADPGTDLFYYTMRRPAPRGELRSHEQARLEALGIERMLDLVDEDDYARGTTRASFDARQALDLCADLVARTARLPADHPHRRVTVVGRGDWGGDEAERRAGQRYRSAMRRALQEGLPVDRIQLLRGASLGWFRALTTRSMEQLLSKRSENARQADPGMRLYLSTRQPHTISVLVLGDIERALREADYRHVRVALMVEAATVEPEGAWARVRVTRAGLFSARPEILHATLRLLDALRDEHRWLVRRAPLADDPALVQLLDEDGAIRPRGDLPSLHVLRQALCRLQLREWRTALAGEVRQEHLPDSEALGRWMARTMAATGVLDEVSLRGLLVAPHPSGGFTVDPERLDAVIAQGGPIDLRRIGAITPPTGRMAPPQALAAADIDADDIERWIGWKRFLHGAQVIPDTRGKDLDLAFDERGITQRASAYLRRACELSRANPGRVMVVIAGDGLNPVRERPAGASHLLDAHHEALIEPGLRYLRIQHASGTHLSWFKDVIAALSRRPSGSQPVALQWEAAHGTSVNVLLVCVRDAEVPEVPWSLEGWSVERCSVLISELRGTGVRDYRVGLFTEPMGVERRVNQDLLHFGRAHCEGLLAQGGARVLAEGGPDLRLGLEDVIVHQIAGWIERVRGWGAHAPLDPEARARWVAGQLGLADSHLARALAEELDGSQPAAEAARSVWEGVPVWRAMPFGASWTAPAVS